MKRKIILTSVLMICSSVAMAGDGNPLFGNSQNQIAIYGGYSLGDVKPESSGGLAMLQYSQPIKLFRLDARQNIHAGYSSGEPDPWAFAGASLDAVFIAAGDFYLGAGIGAFIRTKQTGRLNSRFTFGERGFVGYRITEKFSAEFFVQHFSNGDLTDKNLGYNFIGLSANMNF